MGTHSKAFSRGAYPRWTCWAEANSDPSCARSGAVDSYEMIALHRSNRSKPPTQDRRRSSRYMRRWPGRALLRLDTLNTVLASHPRPLGISRPQLSRPPLVRVSSHECRHVRLCRRHAIVLARHARATVRRQPWAPAPCRIRLAVYRARRSRLPCRYLAADRCNEIVHHDRVARCPAPAPAMRPNTDPFISPVPPG